jgi:histidinol-phosphate/aromatic aminotransferase/cobyric acid decarboxylase-like protein
VIKARPEVEALRPYVAPLEGRRSLLRLDFNESTVGPSPRVVDAIGDLPPEAYATYPEYAGLTEAFARWLTGPYDINMFAVVAGQAALADPEHMRGYVAAVQAAKAWTTAELARLGVRHAGAGGNYVLVWPPRECAQVVQALRAAGILVRSMAGKPVIEGSFRLTEATLADMRRFLAAFTAAIA